MESSLDPTTTLCGVRLPANGTGKAQVSRHPLSPQLPRLLSALRVGQGPKASRLGPMPRDLGVCPRGPEH